MKAISRIALGMALALGGSAIALTPATAKKSEEQKPVQVSEAVAPDLQAALNALQNKDYATAQAKISSAQAKAKTDGDRYNIGVLMFNLGGATSNQALQSQGIDMIIASNAAPPAQLKELLHNQGALAYNAHDMVKAEAAFSRLVDLDPTDGDSIITLAALKAQNRKPDEAMALVNKAIAAKKAANQPIPESWYQRGLAIANDAHSPQAVDFSMGLVSAYPTPDNWRDSLMVYRDLAPPDPTIKLDLMRLARAAHALKGEADYYDYANGAMQRGLPGEAKAVLDEGIAARAIDPGRPVIAGVRSSSGAKIAGDKASLPGLQRQAMASATGKIAASTGDAYLGYGEYAQAITLYRAALQKGGVDTAAVQTHLGIALALSGDKAGAQQAFAQVTGPRATTAKYWSIWAGGRAG